MKLFSLAVYPLVINWHNPDLLHSPFVILRETETNSHIQLSVKKRLAATLHDQISQEIINAILDKTLGQLDTVIPTHNAFLVQSVVDKTISHLSQTQISSLIQGHEGAKIKELIDKIKTEFAAITEDKKNIVLNERQSITDKIVANYRPQFSQTKEKKLSSNTLQIHREHPGFYSFSKNNIFLVLETDCYLGSDFAIDSQVREELTCIFLALLKFIDSQVRITHIFKEPHLYSFSVVKAAAPPIARDESDRTTQSLGSVPSLELHNPRDQQTDINAPLINLKLSVVTDKNGPFVLTRIGFFKEDLPQPAPVLPLPLTPTLNL